jgi:hypothetical protein
MSRIKSEAAFAGPPPAPDVVSAMIFSCLYSAVLSERTREVEFNVQRSIAD